jgi:lipoyl-dependent peroxiredoxin
MFKSENKIEKVLYTGKTHTTGGREGAARSDDGRLDIQLTTPGTQGVGTNPEQLLAAGWSACFLGAMKKASLLMKVPFPKDAAVFAEVDLGMTDEAYFLQARLNVSLPGVDRPVAQEIAYAAHQICPYSKATHGNINVDIQVIS